MNTFFDLKQKEGLRETDLWVILDEEKLRIVKKNGEPMKFHSEGEADTYASGCLHLWIAVRINFLDKWWKHEPSHDHDGDLLVKEWISDDERAKRNPNKFNK